ncbi:MAG: hypothetical protein TREMPRED_002688 [Tremellales sp. Tagirdzhanova-0007]|nr:MAG: hypothetical protein TREMPRED_002688 [Tremellales sp. Tagirdzhanova-0007]
MSNADTTESRTIVYWAPHAPDDKNQVDEILVKFYTEDADDLDVVEKQFESLPRQSIGKVLDSDFKRPTMMRRTEDILGEWTSGLNDTSSPHIKWTSVMVSRADFSCFEALVDVGSKLETMADFENVVNYDRAGRVCSSKQVFCVQTHVDEKSGAITISLKSGIHYKQTQRGSFSQQGTTEGQSEDITAHQGASRTEHHAKVFQEKFKAMAISLISEMESKIVRGDLVFDSSTDLLRLTDSILDGSDGLHTHTTTPRPGSKSSLNHAMDACAVSPESFKALGSLLSGVFHTEPGVSLDGE